MICWASSGSLLTTSTAWARGKQTCARVLEWKQAQNTLSSLERPVTLSHLGRIGGYLDWAPRGRAVVFGKSDLGGGNGMVSNLGAEPRSAEGLVVRRSLTMCEQESIASRSVLSLSMSALTTSGLPPRKRSTRAPKRERSELRIMKIFSMVLKVMPRRPLQRQQA